MKQPRGTADASARFSVGSDVVDVAVVVIVVVWERSSCFHAFSSAQKGLAHHLCFLSFL